MALADTKSTSPSLLARDPAESTLDAAHQPRSQLAILWRGLRRDSFALIGGSIVLFTLVLAVAAPLVSPHDPLKQNSKIRLSPIGTSDHWLGTDGNGRDILSRLIYGGRTALMVAIVPVVIAAALGLAMGLAAGYFGGWTDSVL